MNDVVQMNGYYSHPHFLCFVRSYVTGLQIILPKPNEMIYLSYAWLPVTQKITSFVGIAICNHPLKKEHILVCKMTPKEDIGVIIASMIHTEYIKMLVIVSLDERLSIDNLPRNQKWLYPIAVVTAHSGNILGQVLSKYPDDTIATIHLQKPNVIEAREVVQRPPLTKTSGILFITLISNIPIIILLTP